MPQSHGSPLSLRRDRSDSQPKSGVSAHAITLSRDTKKLYEVGFAESVRGPALRGQAAFAREGAGGGRLASTTRAVPSCVFAKGRCISRNG